MNDDSANDSGVVQLGQGVCAPGEMDDTVAFVHETKSTVKITVHRGNVCNDLMNFFINKSKKKAEAEALKHATFEIIMLKETGYPEVAEDNGGVMRDALAEFWDTFYVQFCTGKTQVVPVLRHDMQSPHWKAIGCVIRMGFCQENIFPVKLARPFAELAVLRTTYTDVVEPFLQFLPEMDRNTLEDAMI